MRPRLPEEIRRKVINDWLSGYGRDEITRRAGASSGTVFNIRNTLEQDLGKAEADALRELAKSIRLSPAQYMVGIRISNMLKRVGLDPKSDEIEQFLVNVCDECMNRGFSPETIASHMEDLANIPSNVRLPELEEYRTKMTAEIKALSEQKQGLINDISTLQQKRSHEEKNLEETLEQTRKIEYEILLFSDTKALLDRFNLTMTEFATNLKDMIAWGGEPKQIVAKFDEMKKFDRERVARKNELDVMERKLASIRKEYYSIQNLNSSYSQKIDVLKKFDDDGIDLTEFYDTIMRISTSNGLPFYLAFHKFFQDISEQYDMKLGFESQIESLKSEIESLNFKLGKLFEEERENEEKKLNVPKGSGISFVFDGKTIEL
jgi:prefoldin subunit 5